MRLFSYTVTWLDRGRYERRLSGICWAGTVAGAARQACHQAKKSAKENKQGWTERNGMKFFIKIEAGDVSTKTNKKEGGR